MGNLRQGLNQKEKKILLLGAPKMGRGRVKATRPTVFLWDSAGWGGGSKKRVTPTPRAVESRKEKRQENAERGAGARQPDVANEAERVRPSGRAAQTGPRRKGPVEKRDCHSQGKIWKRGRVNAR